MELNFHNSKMNVFELNITHHNVYIKPKSILKHRHDNKILLNLAFGLMSYVFPIIFLIMGGGQERMLEEP